MTDIFHVEMLPGREGDCLWIEYGDNNSPNRILIDGGRQIAYDYLKKRFEKLPKEYPNIELGILTHVDADHVEGILKILEDQNRGVEFHDFWFNAYHHLDYENFKRLTSDNTIEEFGAVQGERLTEALVKEKWPWNERFNNGPISIEDDGPLITKTLPGGMKITILSPTQVALKSFENTWEREVKKAGLVPGAQAPEEEEEVLDDDTEAFGALDEAEIEYLANLQFKKDTSRANRSSIAILAEYKGKKVLFAGDAHADILSKSIQKCPGYNGGRLKIDAFKVSHHGSRKTLSNDVLTNIECERYLISTNGSRHGHPDREAMARIVKLGGNNKHIYFNYCTDQTKEWNNNRLKKVYKYCTHYPDDKANGNIKVDIMKPTEDASNGCQS